MKKKKKTRWQKSSTLLPSYSSLGVIPHSDDILFLFLLYSYTYTRTTLNNPSIRFHTRNPYASRSG